MQIDVFRTETLAFIARHRLSAAGAGAYRYARSCRQPTLYASCYAAMTRALFDDLDLPDGEQQAWIAYINQYQDDDGLYRDPVIFDQGWYADDPFDCGRPHLTCHVVTALACLGGVAARPVAMLQPFTRLHMLANWLEGREWGARVAWTGNEIMNLGTLLQYARDFHGDARAGAAVAFLLDWLEAHHLNADSGVWGTLNLTDPLQRSHAVQAAYHWWPLFSYDGRPFPHSERAIDTVLATQNPRGSFGWGVHNPADPHAGSACEDIDSIDPLVRLARQTDYRREEIHAALARAVEWVFTNRTPDGGFTFLRDRAFTYGHLELHSDAGAGAMFPTWFRTLALALIAQALPDSPLGQYPWCFVNCPGFQFYPESPADNATITSLP